MLDLRLPDRLRAKGLTVELYPGWETRSAGLFHPVGALNHHTAGAPTGRAPSLATVVYGRPGIPGPLSQTLQTREDDGWDHVIVVAAGRANHAGTGIWRGVSGNVNFSGNEVEHTGTGTVPEERLEVMARVQAAFLEAPGASWDFRMSAQHFEYATPLGRKVDFRDLAPWSAETFRARVGFWVGRHADAPPAPLPPPPPPPEEDDDMKPHKLKIAGTAYYAYVLPDGTVVDLDYKGTPIDGNEIKNFVAVYETEQANPAQVDQVQSAVKRARTA